MKGEKIMIQPTSLVSTNKPPLTPLEKLIKICTPDSEENGGYSGTIRKKPLPFPVCEERTKTIDPKTGKEVYADTLQFPGAIYLLG